MNKKIKLSLFISLFIIIFTGLLLIATFYDYQITDFLAKNFMNNGNYFSSNVFARIFEVVGETPLYLFVILALIIIVINLQKVNKKAIKIIFSILFLLIALFIGYYGWSRVGKYLAELHPNTLSFLHGNPLMNVAYVLLSLIVEATLYYFINKYFKNLSYKLLPIAIICLICAVLSNAFVQGIKPLVARERYRATYLLNSLSEPIIHNGFTRWYVFNGPSSVIVENLKAQGLETAKSTYYASFPSGHTCAVAIVYTLMYIPFFFDKMQNKKYRWIFIVIPILIVAIVAISRMVMGAHYLSDVLFGGTVSFISALIGYFIVKAIFKNKKI